MQKLDATSSIAVNAADRLIAAMVCAVLGLVFIAGVGFARIDAVHAAAHDGRHAFSFPCH